MTMLDGDAILAGFRILEAAHVPEPRPLVLTPDEWQRFKGRGDDMSKYVEAVDKIPFNAPKP
jgi:hypothetical protein